jgi:hypothetical protein
MRIVAWGLLAAIFSGLLIGCSDGGGSTGSGENVLSLQFVNQRGGTGEWRSRVIIEACGHDFRMEPDEVKVVNCVPEGEERSVLVRVEFPWGQYNTIVKTATVSDGQVVTLTSEATLEVSG